MCCVDVLLIGHIRCITLCVTYWHYIMLPTLAISLLINLLYQLIDAPVPEANAETHNKTQFNYSLQYFLPNNVLMKFILSFNTNCKKQLCIRTTIFDRYLSYTNSKIIDWPSTTIYAACCKWHCIASHTKLNWSIILEVGSERFHIRCVTSIIALWFGIRLNFALAQQYRISK